MTTIAEIRAKVTGGIDINNVLGTMRTGTLNAKDATLLLQEAIRNAGRATTAAAKTTQQAAKDAITDLKLHAAAQREQISLTKQQEQAQRKSNLETHKMVHTVKELAHHASEAFKHFSKMAGVRSFEQMKEQGDELEELFTRTRISMDLTKKEWEELGAKKIIFDVAIKSGQKVEDVLHGLKEAQNETSKESSMSLLADHGKNLLAESKFATVTGGPVGAAAVTSLKFAKALDIPVSQQHMIPGMFYKQHIEGSLTGDTAAKFIKNLSSYNMLSGGRMKGPSDEVALKKASEFMAINNIVKDQLNTGPGLQGAAAASTITGAIYKDLMKGKGFGSKDHSATAILSGMLGHNIKDKEGYVDFDKLTKELVAYKQKVGSAKFGTQMLLAFRQVQSFRGMMGLVTNAEIENAKNGGKGSGKALENLSNPNIIEGLDSVDEAHKDLMDSANRKNIVLGNKEAEKILTHQEDTKDTWLWLREKWGGFKADHPVFSAVQENPGVQGAEGAATLLAMKKLAPGLLAKALPVLAGLPGLALGMLTSSGDTAKENRGSAQEQIENRKKAIEANRKEMADRHSDGLKGWFTRNIGEGNDERSQATIDRLSDEISKLQATIAAPPNVNVTVNLEGNEFKGRTVPEAKTTQTLAHGKAERPARPGRH